ncbi:uncharacterized protein V1516DRAFT_678768 [Lipomyces oligophaga]|uniref:uncharacterized protein n=1 Tax=Lipomyces oligophaga TaxID=45792 RepID=UPI0034CD1451
MGVFPKQSRIKHQMAQMVKLSTGPAAVKVEPTIQKVKLVFGEQADHPTQTGLKQFWHEYLPTIKFHNIDLTIKVNDKPNPRQRKKAEGAAMLYIKTVDHKFRKADVRDQSPEQILQTFIELSKAQSVDITESPVKWSP